MKKLLQTSVRGQSGAIHTLPLFLIIAAVGIISYLLISSTAPFKGGIFGMLNPKPASHAAFTGFSNVIDMAYPCGLTNPAFCDNFSEGPAPAQFKGRGNDLDLRRWSFGRDTGNTNSSTSGMSIWVPIDETAHCKDVFKNVNAPLDSWFCGDEVPEPEHWMESFNDGGSFVSNDARIRQPFDFTNRTGLIQYGVDFKTMGGHGWWTETWVTDQPVPAVHDSAGSGNNSIPKNGIGMVFASSCDLPQTDNNTAADGAGHTGIDGVSVMTDYNTGTIFAPNELGWHSNCVVTKPDVSNMIQIRLSTSRIEIWASDAGSNVMKEIYGSNFQDANGNPVTLPFSVGFVNFSHAAYNAEKAGALHYVTYHWHDMGFDGPVHQNPRAYEVPDSLTPVGGGSVELGYMVQTDGTINTGAKKIPGFTFNNVDGSGASGARLIFTTGEFGPGDHIQYQFNNGTWRTYNFPSGTPFEDPNNFWAGQLGHVVDVPIADLVQGTNNLKLKATDSAGNPREVQLSNFDLEVLPTDTTTTPSAVGMISCHLMDLMMFVMPSMQMTANDPCMGNPNVSITTPANNQVFAVPPATIPISVTASAVSPATSISKVVISHGATTLATLTSAPYNFTWNNVAPGNYVITAIATDNLGNQRLSQSNVTVNPPIPVIADAFNQVTVTNITGNSATINWTTDKPSDSQVKYGFETAEGAVTYPNATTLDSTPITNHSVTLTGLNAMSIYHFKVYSGNSFGVAESIVHDLTTGAPAAGNGPFTGNYWNLPTGATMPPTVPTTTPDLTRTDNTINFDFGMGSPDPKIHSDNFAARWTGTINIPADNVYTFATSSVDDGVRFYIDGKLIIDKWSSSSPRTYFNLIPLTAGSHTIKVEYFEGIGGASIKLGWQVFAPYIVDGWQYCANQGQLCLFSGTKQVRYGIDGFYSNSVQTDGVSCTDDVLQNPVGAHAIHCDYSTVGTATPTPMPTPTPTATPLPTPTPAGPWTTCAMESGKCNTPGTMIIRYGANSSFLYGTFTNGVSCTQGSFGGDPIFGTAKHCEGNFATSSGPWTTCANDGGQCNFSGTMQVRFGAGTTFVYGIFTNGVACSTNTFGDPIFGTVKHCEVSTNTFSPNPSPSGSGLCPKASMGDVDCDNAIGIFDFNILITNFGKTGTSLQGDLDGNGKVDIFDFNTLVTNFGH